MKLTRPLSRVRCTTAALLSLLLVAACGGSDNGGPTEPDPTPTVAIAVAPTSLQLQQGSAEQVTVSVTRGGGFSGPVTVEAQNLPGGVTAPSVTVPSGSTSATMTFTAAADAPATTPPTAAEAPASDADGDAAPRDAIAAQAPVSVTLRASGAGVAAATASLSLSVTPAPTGSFAVALASGTLSVQQGASGTVGVTVSRQAPFTGPVTLTVGGAPDGVTATLDPNEVDGTASTLDIAVGGSVTPGDYTLTVTGSADGPDDAGAELTLTVTAAPTGSFSLTLDTDALSVRQGNTGSVGVTVARQDPFAGAVTLSVSGAPAGATIAVDPAEVAGTSATVEVTLADDAAVGNHTITVTGSGDGVAQQSASFTLTITARPAGSDEAWSFCPTVPTWFAVKDGDGPWQAVTPVGNTFDFNVSSDRVGIAWVISDADGPELTVQFLGAAEVASVGEQQCSGPKTIAGTTVGVGPLNTAYVSMGGASAVVIGSGGPNFTLEGVRDGTVDLFGTNTALNFGAGTFTLEQIYLERGLDPVDGSVVTVDFTGPDAFAPGSATLTANGLDGDQAIVTMIYSTPGASGVLLNQITPSAATTRSFPTVPADRQGADDLHGLTLSTLPPGAGPLGAYRSATLFFRDPTDRTITMGPDLGDTNFDTGTTAPYLRPRVTYTRQAEYNRYFFVNYQQDVADRYVTVFATDDYLDGADIDLIVPDFSGTAGWNDAWGLVPGETMTFAFTASGWPGPGDVAPEALAEGLQTVSGIRSGEIDP